MCTVKYRPKDKLVKCRFFVVPGNSQALLAILRITFEVIDGQQAGRKFDSQMMGLTAILNCKTHSEEDHRSVSVDANHSNVNRLDYFMCSKEAHKEANRAIMQNIHSEFSDFFRNWLSQGHIQVGGERRQPFIPSPTKENGIHTPITT